MFFFFNDTATTEIYTLSLHDALPIYARRASDHRALRAMGAHHAGAGLAAGLRRRRGRCGTGLARSDRRGRRGATPVVERDRKSTRLNSSHANISYAVFCLKKKKSSIT